MDLLEFHRHLLADRVGQEGFRKALFETIQGGETVLDLGTGTGIHALFACQAGAKRVYAVDQHEVIELAWEICEANGYSDRITFLHAPAEQIELTEQVDIIVAHHSLATLCSILPDARDRFLKKGGVLIPASAELFCAPLQAPAAYDEMINFWERPHFDLTFSPVRLYAINSVHDYQIDPGDFLGDPVRLTSLDFSQMKRPMLSEEIEAKITRPGILHGVGIWLVQWLTKRIELSTAPPSNLSPRLWLHCFIPIASPTSVEPGETARIRIRTGTGGWGKLWTWEVAVVDRGGQEKARFAHSNFSSWLLPKETLRKQSLAYVPRLTPRGAALQFALDCCDGTKSLRRIESEVFARFPTLFKSSEDAAEFVSDVITRYSQ